MSHRNNPVFRRSGFTLVEMLVAIGILTVIATLSVAVIPKIQERAKASRGGDQLQGWLLEAKQMALRDRAPRGIRLFVDLSTKMVLTAQYIQQPDNFTGGAIQFDNPTMAGANMFKASFIGVDITGGLSSINPSTGLPYALNDPVWPVQPGDFILVQGGVSHQITTVVGPSGATPAFILTVPTLQYPNATQLWDPVNLPPAPAPNYIAFNYTIIRQPRPMIGEPLLQLPDDVGIDPTLSLADSLPLSSLGGVYDIVFSPSGTLTGTLGNGFSRIILWVRDYTQDIDQPGQMPLICVFCRTGRTGGFPNNYQNGNPYLYVLDPRATGL